MQTPISSIKKAYGNLKIRDKLFIIILIAAATPMIFLAIFISGRMYRMVASDTLREEQQAAAQTAPVIQKDIDSVTDFSDTVRDMSFSQTLFDETLQEPLEDLLHSDAATACLADIKEQMKGTGVSAVRIYIDLPKDDPCFEDMDPDTSVFSSAYNIHAAYWFGIFSGSHPASLYCPPMYLTPSEEKSLGDCAYIRPIYIRTADQTSVKGYLACYFLSTALQNTLISQLDFDGSVSYITNERDAMITSTDSALSGIYYMDYDKIRSSLMSSNGFIAKKVLGEDVYVSYYYLTTADWFLVTVTPSRPLRQKANQVIFGIICVWLLAGAISVLIAWLMARSLTSRISAVSAQMSSVRNGPPVPMPSPEETDEIGDLTDSYNYMARQINNLMDQQKKQSEELRQAEFKSLQAQINPHFLYNTMEMINWMAQQGRIKETNQAIQSLSRFYKLTLSRKKTISSIAEELEQVTIYAQLQNMRFENGIDFVVDVPDELTEYQIPRLTLQPIVENAILHGILEKGTHRGTIVITGWLEDQDVVLLVTDDGVGIPEDILASILTKKNVSTGKGNQIAVYNTHRRLQILYGERYGLTYRSTVGEGTEVEIRIPAKYPE